ncbi:MAG: universal stress protein [Deltaproteobacteria bacterium]|nr:universal stress protein [Deltaproteobacteria bacterium]
MFKKRKESRSGLTRWALGSVADKVLSCSHVPVMLFRVSKG